MAPTSPGRPRKITGAQEQRIADAYQAGATIRTIAAAEHLSPSGIRYCLRRAKVQPRPHRRLIDDRRLPHIAAAYYSGKPTHAIAADLGCSYCTAYTGLRRAGVTMRPPGPAPHHSDLVKTRQAEADAAHRAFFTVHATTEEDTDAR